MNKNINKTGYLKGSKTEKNPYNIIPSNQITMKGVENTILGMKLDKDGNFVGMKFMKPSKDYDFEDAMSILEIPKYQRAGVHTQPYDLFNLPGDIVEEGSALGVDENGNPISYAHPGVLSEDQTITQDNVIEQLQTNPLISGAEDVDNIGNEVLDSTGSNIRNDRYAPEVQAMLDEENLLDADGNVDVTLEDPEWYNNLGKSGRGGEDINVSPDDIVDGGRKDGLDVDQMETEKFFNPYAGIDIPTAATVLGQSVEDGKTGQAIFSGLKLAAGLGRNFFGGMGQARVDNWINEEKKKKMNQPTDTYIGEHGGQYLKHGGVKKEEILTGEYMTGVDPDLQAHMANAEVEAGEYIKTNQDEVVEVVGNKHSQGGELVPLEEGEEILSDYDKLGAKSAKYIRDNFDLEVKAKNTPADVLDKFKTKIGLKNLLKEEESVLKQLEKVDNMEESQTKGLNMGYLQKRLDAINKQKEPIEKARVMLFNKMFEIQEMAKPEAERAPRFRKGGKQMYQVGGEKQRLEDFYTQTKGLGYEGDFNIEAEDLGAEAGKLQSFMVENKSKEVIDYFRNGQPITAKGIDSIKDSNPEVFEEAGIDISKESSTLTPDERITLQSKMDEKGLLTDEFILDQFHDNKWEYRFPTLGVNPVEEQAGTGMFDPKGTGVPYDKYMPETYYTTDIATVERIEGDKDELTTELDRLNVMLMPDQYPMIPRGQEPHLKVERRFDTVEPVQVDPEPYMQKIDTDLQTALNQIDAAGLSPQVAEAAKANARSSAKKSLNEAMIKVDVTNLASRQNAEQINSQIQRMEENAGAMDDLSYEQRQLTAKAKTDADMDAYFDKIDQVNIGNYMTIEALNRSNEMFSDVQATGSSSFDVNTPQGFKNMLDMYMAMQAAQDKEEKNKK
jgi:hypothetical protein